MSEKEINLRNITFLWVLEYQSSSVSVSNYDVVFGWIRALLNNGIGQHIILFCGKNYVVPDDLLTNENVKFLVSGRMHLYHFGEREQVFKTISNLIDNVGIDVFFIDIPVWVHDFVFFLVYKYKCGFNNLIPPIFTVYHYPLDDSLGGNLLNKKNTYLLFKGLQYVSSFMTVNIFHSQYAQKLVEKNFSEIFGSSVFNNIEKDFIYVRINYEEMVKSRKNEKKEKVFVYNHRFANYKRPDLVFALYDKLYEKDKNVKVRVFRNDFNIYFQIFEKVLGREYVELYNLPMKSDYFSMLSECEGNVLYSEHETFCVSIAESMFLGVIPFVPKRVTFPELLGEDWEYFLTGDVDVDADIVSEIINDRKKMVELREYCSRRIREIVNDKIISEKFLYYIKKRVIKSVYLEKVIEEAKKFEGGFFYDFSRKVRNMYGVQFLPDPIISSYLLFNQNIRKKLFVINGNIVGGYEKGNS